MSASLKHFLSNFPQFFFIDDNEVKQHIETGTYMERKKNTVYQTGELFHLFTVKISVLLLEMLFMLAIPYMLHTDTCSCSVWASDGFYSSGSFHFSDLHSGPLLLSGLFVLVKAKLKSQSVFARLSHEYIHTLSGAYITVSCGSLSFR